MNPAVTSSSITYTGFGAQATYGNQSTYLSPMSMYNYLSTKFGDGEVTVSDVNAIIHAIVTGMVQPSADVNHDSEITVGDVNTVIGYILK